MSTRLTPLSTCDQVLATLMELAEGLSIEELQYRLSRGGREDDWSTRMHAARAHVADRAQAGPGPDRAQAGHGPARPAG